MLFKKGVIRLRTVPYKREITLKTLIDRTKRVNRGDLARMIERDNN